MTLGFADDYSKVVKRHNLGMSGRTKIAFQVLVSALAGTILLALSTHR